jgi:hypothetical protein
MVVLAIAQAEIFVNPFSMLSQAIGCLGVKWMVLLP